MEYVAEQAAGAGEISSRRMFGAYCLYCGGKPFSLIVEDLVYVKPTGAGRVYIGEPEEAPPFPGAKNWFVVEDRLDDREWFSGLVRTTADALPLPKPKKARKKAGAGGRDRTGHRYLINDEKPGDSPDIDT